LAVDHFEIASIRENNLAEVATFLATSEAARDAKPEAADRSIESILERLHWRLMDNPARFSDDLGQCLRSAGGGLVGVNLMIPSWFRFGDQRLRGLCGGSFFVEPAARMQGFFLFRRFLKTNGADFVFATTCNASAGALWKKLGAKEVPDSDCRWTLILNGAPIAEELALRKGAGRAVAAMSRMAGRLAKPLLAPGKGRQRVSFRPCRDWDRLASLAAQNRDPCLLACERSAAHLAWRYEQSPAPEGHHVYEFAEQGSNVGWLAVGRKPNSGLRRQIRNFAILDIVRPRMAGTGASLLGALSELYADRADQIEVPATLARESSVGRPRLWRRPNGFAVAYVLGNGKASGNLAEAADFYLADGDSAD
jgi:hypothetical protein